MKTKPEIIYPISGIFATNMKKISLILVLFALSVNVFAKVPAEWSQRYKGLMKVIESLDFDAFSGYFAPGFVNVDPKGRITKRAEFLNGLRPIFKSAVSAKAREKLSIVVKGKGYTDVHFDFHLEIKSDESTLLIHEVGYDRWKLIHGKWMMIKTVDKVMTMNEKKS